jgi:hypothetical protein
VPYSLDPWEQSPQSQLAGIFVTVPGFLEDYSSVDRNGDEKLRDDLLHRVSTQLENLFRWRWEWDVLNPNAAWETEFSEKTSGLPTSNHCVPSISRLCGKHLHFSTLSQASEIMLYDAILLWLIGLLWKLNPTTIADIVLSASAKAKSSSEMLCCLSVDSTGSLLVPGATFHLRETAIEICRCFSFQIDNIKGQYVSSLFFLLPVGIGWSVLERDPEWKVAISEELASSRTTRGYLMGQNVFGFGSFAVPQMPV